MQWTGDVASGFWISSRLRGWGLVGGTLPRGFEAYARVFHPAEARRIVSAEPIEVDTRSVTWAEVAAARGTTWHPAMQWTAVVGSQYDETDFGDGWLLGPPELGRLPLGQLAVISELLARHTATPADAILGLWSGWGELHPGSGMGIVALTKVDDETDHDAQNELDQALHDSVSDDVAHAASIGPTLELPGRGYVLLEADVRELTDPNWVHTAGLGWHLGVGPTPNILWPADQAWFLASEIDFDSTLIGGSRALVDAILGSRDLEVAEVQEDTDLTLTGDSMNQLPSP